MSEQAGQDAAKLGSALWTNFIVAVIGVVLFSVRRTKDTDVYSPRTIYASTPTPVLRDGLCAWVSGILKIPEKDILNNVGLDAVMFLRFMKMATQFFAFCSVYGILVLMPLNAYGFDASQVDQVCVDTTTGNTTVPVCEDQEAIKDLGLLSLANVTPGSNFMFGHVVAIYLFSAAIYGLLLKNYREYTGLRHSFLAVPKPHLHSVLVTSIPEAHRTTEAVAKFFRGIYPNDFHSATITWDTTALAKKVEKRAKTQMKLEGAEDMFKETKERPEHKTKICGGEKVDSIEQYQKEIAELTEEITTLREDDPKANAAAFVTFKTAMTATVVRQTYQTADPSLWIADAAPQPSDVVWKNLKMPPNVKSGRALVISALLFVLVFFWAIPVVFISALSTIENLAKILPFLSPLLGLSPFFKGLIGGVLPTLALIAFMALLPMILKALAMQTGVVSFSQQQLTVGKQYYTFLVFNVFFIILISSSIFSALDELIKSPTSIVSLMGTEIPKASTFFINYMLLQSLSVFPLSLAQLVPLIVSKIKKKAVFKTPKMEKDGMRPSPFEYGLHLPKHLLIFLISFAYSAISPLILPFAVFYFAIGYLVYRQQLIFIHMTPYETGGTFWPIAFDRTIVAVLTGQITVLGVFGLKLAPIPFALAIPLPFITVAFMNHCHNKFEAPSNYIPMDTAANVRDGTEKLLDSGSKAEVVIDVDDVSSTAFLDGVYDDPYLNDVKVKDDHSDDLAASDDIIAPLGDDMVDGVARADSHSSTT